MHIIKVKFRSLIAWGVSCRNTSTSMVQPSVLFLARYNESCLHHFGLHSEVQRAPADLKLDSRCAELSKKIEDVINLTVKQKPDEPVSFMVRER